MEGATCWRGGNSIAACAAAAAILSLSPCTGSGCACSGAGPQHRGRRAAPTGDGHLLLPRAFDPARPTLMVISGTHGVEGYAGQDVQNAVLRQLVRQLEGRASPATT